MKIFVADPIAEKTIEALKNEGHEVIVETELTSEEVGERLQGFDVVIIRSKTKLRREILAKTNGLKVIIRAGVGLDNVDRVAAKEMGIAVRNTPAASARAVAELVVAHMFSLARKLAYADRTMREGKWEKKKLKGFELGGKTLGIIGVGNIGLTVASMAKGIGMDVIGFDVIDTNKGKLEELGGKFVSDMDEVIKNSDFITLHVPLTEHTKGFINKERIYSMKKGACLINTARGGLIDEEALYERLKSGELGGAAFDVFTEEPPKDLKLLELDNFEASPHIGAQTREAHDRIGEEILKILKEYA